MMKILMLGWELPPKMSGGLGTACDGLLSGLHSIGATETTFVLPRLYGDESGQGARLLSTEGNGNAGVTARAPTSAYGDMIGPDVLRFAADIAKTTATVEFDLIHAHDWLTVPAALELKQRTDKPLCLHIHSTEFDRSGPAASPEILAIERAGIRAADMVIAVSQATRRQLIDRFDLPADKVCVIHNGVRFETWPARKVRSPDNPAIVAFVGRVTYQKGPHYFVEAASLLLKQHGDLRFVLAGTGDMLKSSIELAAALGVRDRFEFPGFLDREGVRALFTSADVFVMPSLAEPFGIVALEAIAAEVPVVMSSHAGVAEVVASAHKVDPWDIEAIAGAVDAILRDPAQANSMACAARREACAYDWVRAAKLLTSQYAALTSPPGTGLDVSDDALAGVG